MAALGCDSMMMMVLMTTMTTVMMTYVNIHYILRYFALTLNFNRQTQRIRKRVFFARV